MSVNQNEKNEPYEALGIATLGERLGGITPACSTAPPSPAASTAVNAFL